MKMVVINFCMLFGFWLIITESLHYDSIAVGLGVCLFVVWFNRDIMAQEKEFPRLTWRRLRLLVNHMARLLVEVVKANIQVVRIVLSPSMEFDQGLVIFTPQLHYEWNEVLFANSITLTPGTLTLEVEQDVYTVHILDMTNADSLVGWSIQDNLRMLEEEE